MIRALLLAACLALLFGNRPAAAATSYASAVNQAERLVQAAEAGGPPSDVTRAAEVLRAGTGSTQPEILNDLQQRPPQLHDADVRLRALAGALAAASAAPNPARGDASLRRIMAEPRYAGLSAAPDPITRFLDWLAGQLASLLAKLHVGALGAPNLLEALLALVAAGGMVVLGLILRSVLKDRAARRHAVTQSATRRRLAGDRFRHADDLAARGDFAGAVHELALGVALVLGGDLWEQSPDTVRELFTRADGQSLRPLLVSFEASVYGHLAPGEPEYEAARVAAQPWRERV